MLIFSYFCSLGAFIYDSNPGSGGGAIAFNVTGVLTIGRNCTVMGYFEDHFSGTL